MKVPHLTEVQSSNIHSMGHDGHTLWVRFKSGALYSYPDVPAETYHDGLQAESIGSWFRDNIRGKHEHRKHDG